MKGLILNPVLLKELKLRFRAFKSFSGLMFYLASLIIFVSGFLLVFTEFSVSGFLDRATVLRCLSYFPYCKWPLLCSLLRG